MKKEIIKWYKRNATVVKATAALALLVSYTAFIRGIQQDLDEVRYSREINKIEKDYAKEIEEFKQRIDQLREENMNLRQAKLELMEDYFDKNNKNITRMEVNNENK
jgi:cell division protein FtsB